MKPGPTLAEPLDRKLDAALDESFPASDPAQLYRGPANDDETPEGDSE